MSYESKDEDEITERIKIIATDDEKIKSFGELLTNDSSRAILQLLFNEELTALQIAEKTGISLQLVKYHIIKLQDLGVVKVTKVEKNSKSQDMKFYAASKFSMVIVPPKYSEKTRESKLLVRSFKHIYKIAGFGISAGISGLMSLALLQQESRDTIVFDKSQKTLPENIQEADNSFQSTIEESSSEGISAKAGQAPMPSEIASEPSQDYVLDESLELTQRKIEAAQANPSLGHDGPVFNIVDLSTLLIVIAIVLGGLSLFFFFKSIRQSKQERLV